MLMPEDDYVSSYDDVNHNVMKRIQPVHRINNFTDRTNCAINCVADFLHAMQLHYSDVIMGAMASQITSVTIVCSAVYSGANQRKHQSAASLAFVRGIHRWPVNSPHKGPVTRKMFPFDDVIMVPDNIR